MQRELDAVVNEPGAGLLGGTTRQAQTAATGVSR
jgi:hypothetical protein